MAQTPILWGAGFSEKCIKLLDVKSALRNTKGKPKSDSSEDISVWKHFSFIYISNASEKSPVLLMSSATNAVLINQKEADESVDWTWGRFNVCYLILSAENITATKICKMLYMALYKPFYIVVPTVLREDYSTIFNPTS